MAKVSYKKDTQDSFFGHFLYDQVLPKNHFLVRAKTEIQWGRFNKKLLKYYKGAGEYGASPYAPEKMLRMLLLSYLYNISERQTEEFVSLNMAAKYFVDLGVDEKAPDHSSLSKFKERIIEKAGQNGYEMIFNELIRIACGKGIKFGQIQLVDSVHTIADVNIEKDQRRQKKGKEPRDPDAKWGVKKTKKIKGKDGKEKRVKKSFYGYKTHTSINEESGMVTSIKVTGGNEADNKQFSTLVNKDRKKGIAVEGNAKVDKKKRKIIVKGGSVYTADKAYDDGDNHTFLETRNMHSAIILKNTRTNSKQKENNQAWQEFKDREIYKKATELRYKVEQPYGLAKHWHGFKRCRYLGRTKMASQAYMTFMALNLKQIMKKIANVKFRYNNYAHAYARSRSPG